MDRQFGFPFFSPFFSPFFFGGRRFFPSFFISPFHFPFFRNQDDRDGMVHAQHQVKEGETMGTLAQMYNVPQPILEAMNSHIQNPNVLTPGTTVYIPCMYKMYCNKMYMEDMSGTGAATQMYPPQSSMPYMGMPSNMYPGQQMAPYSG